MGGWVDSLGVIVRDASLSAAGLFGLVALGMLGCRQPVRRLWLARTALVASLALIPLVGLAPFPRVDLAGVLRSPVVLSHPVFDEPGGSGIAEVPSVVAARRVPEVVIRPPRSLVVAYLACCGCGLAWLLLGYWGLGWVTRRSSAPSSTSTAQYASLPCSCERPRLRVSSRVQRPVLVGLLRPTILIPPELDLPEAVDELRLSLLHELAHAKRNDSWFGLASSLAQILWFFLPPLWWIRAQMRLDQEFLADRLAAGTFGPLPSYASSLVNIASPAVESASSPTRVRLNSQADGSPLFLRVLMLLRCPFVVEPRPPRWWALLVPGLVLAGALSLSCVTVGRTAPARPGPGQVASSSALKSRSFRMGRLVVPPAAPSSRFPSTLFELPLRMPDHFDLAVEVWGDSHSLAATRVAGRLLGPSPIPGGFPDQEQWHSVRIRRDAYGLTLWIDQVRLPRTTETQTTSWLSVEPPVGQTGHFRNLHLVW